MVLENVSGGTDEVQLQRAKGGTLTGNAYTFHGAIEWVNRGYIPRGPYEGSLLLPFDNFMSLGLRAA